MKANSKTELKVETVINAPLPKVWECWVDPDHIVQWNHASDDWHSPSAENDLRVGGHFKAVMAAKDGSVSFDFGGVYTNIITHQLIEYTMSDGRNVKVTFEQLGYEVKVVELFEAENTHSQEQQINGWQAILDNFKIHVEKNK